MAGKNMRQLIETGTCPQCKSALQDQKPDRAGRIGTCGPCNIVWVTTDSSSTTEAFPANLR